MLTNIKDNRIIVDIEVLKYWDANPRGISSENLEELKESIKKYGQFLPLSVMEDGTVLSGNMRLRAMKEIGVKEVWIDLVYPKDDQEKMDIAFACNMAFGEFVKNKLETLVISLPDVKFDYKINIGKPISVADIVGVKDGENKPEIEFSQELMEENNYVVLVFDNEMDWTQLLSIYPLVSVKALDSEKGFEKVGVGRVIRGVDFINKIKG